VSVLGGMSAWLGQLDDLVLATVAELLAARAAPTEGWCRSFLRPTGPTRSDNVRRLLAVGCRVLVVTAVNQPRQGIDVVRAGASGH